MFLTTIVKKCQMMRDTVYFFIQLTSVGLPHSLEINPSDIMDI